MSKPEHKDPFLQQVQATLERSAQTLDDATLRELRQARYTALEARQRRPAWLLPMGGLAAAATVAVFSVSLWLAAPQPGVNEQLPLEDLALLEDSESLEFYEDLDFYLWLDDEQQDAG
ncbi:MAG TPA: hypothetical protein ENI97_07135 [Gammaproteobacteria bacterium]|nr:hypothetical protein [Gammaproteobacteria bacterium]